jgi:hypothetical protein
MRTKYLKYCGQNVYNVVNRQIGDVRLPKKNSFEIVLTVIRVVKVTAARMVIEATYIYDFCC